MRQETKVYHARHNAKRKNRTVSFRLDTQERELYEFAGTLPNFGEWVKGKIKQEINKIKKENKQL